MDSPGCCSSGRNLREWDDPLARELSANLRPLEKVAVERLSNWLPKLSRPVRIGEHDQTAFALGLILDYARSGGNEALAKLATDSAKKFFLERQRLSARLRAFGRGFPFSISGRG